ncbi:family 10 glycosylhydrolase [Crocosphaera sp. UHCC 0190]|nr:family 10 glycosylhydrolase [Crocosphaera sp. UHCC 0190]MEA5508926.1 family 10 glycosylhydrolase [Crocosphaera sp. UHCC 0190]
MNQRSLTQKLLQSIIGSLVILGNSIIPLTQIKAVQAAIGNYCQFSPDAIAMKENFLQTALKGDPEDTKNYQILVRKQAEELRRCRAQTWPQEQAIWLRFYPCDVRPGSVEAVLDRIVNKGYNTVYVEVFADSQVLLPPADNPTPWDTVVRTPGAERVDLLAQAIQKGRERGLKVYAWVFTLNFGYVYAQRSDRQSVLARNGKGQDSTKFVHDQSQAFVDPYNRQAQTDYYSLLQAVLKRRPDGVLFDYVRYPRGTGTQSAVGKVKDLWIYSAASQQAFYERGLNNKGRDLIQRYVTKGYITVNDVLEVDKIYPDEGSPLWQGRVPPATEGKDSLQVRYQRLKTDLWYLAVAHAAQGVINFVSFAASAVERNGIPAGAVFFPDGNQLVGDRGFDSRLQAWDKFPPSLEFHPMAYGLCKDAACIVKQVERVVKMSPPKVKITPAIAGVWGKTQDNRPTLETQMAAIRAKFPQLRSLSHFAFSWQEPEFDQSRRFCR